MNTNQIATVFNRAYHGQRNLMTPTVLEWGEKGKLLYELSEGPGIWTPKIYGVTILTKTGDKKPELSSCFNDVTEALQYIEALEDAEE